MSVLGFKKYFQDGFPDKTPLWKIFITLTLANALISYFPSPLWIKFVLGVLFVAGPLVLLVRSPALPPSQVQKAWDMDFFPNPSWILIGLAAVGGGFLRLSGLTTLSAWPTFDEGWVGLYVFKLFKKWNWDLLLSDNQIPPAHFWGQALFFRWWGPSLPHLWLFPALLSTGILVLGYWATRLYFSKSFSFFCLLFGVVNYWLLWSGRFSEPPADTAVLFECLALGALGMMWRALGKNQPGPWPFLSGMGVGMSAYASTVSIYGAAFMSLTALWAGWKAKEFRKPLWLGFGAGLCIVVPLLVYALRYGYGHYPASIWVTKDSGYYENHWMAPLSHISGVFWGARDWTLWGGLLNPVESALVFLGIAFTLKTRRSSLQNWLLLALVFFFLPGLFTNNYEPFRSVLTLPVLVVLTVVGLGWLLSECHAGMPRKLILSVVLASCAALNFYHLWGPYHQTWGVQGPGSSRFKAIENWRAFDELRSIQEKSGPGFVFTDFAMADDQLIIPTYPFNILENPKLSPRDAPWAAFLINAHFAPFLKRSLSECRWSWLSEHIAPAQGGLEMGVFLLTEKNMALLERWRKAQAVLRDALYETLDLKTPGSNDRALRLLKNQYSYFQGDRFLETVYWDKVQAYQMSAGNVPAAVKALQNGLRRGFRNDYFCLLLGGYLDQEGRKEEAGRAFAEAKALMKETDTKGLGWEFH